MKYTILAFGNIQVHLIKMEFNYMPLTQMERENGVLNLDNLKQTQHHFILVTIFLVVEDQEIMC